MVWQLLSFCGRTYFYFKKRREETILKTMKTSRWCNTSIGPDEFIELILDAITEPVIIFDTELRIVKINKAGVRFFQEYPVGRRCFAIKHTMAPICKDCPAWQSIRTGRTASAEMYDPDTGHTLLIKTYPIFDKAGEVNAVALVGLCAPTIHTSMSLQGRNVQHG